MSDEAGNKSTAIALIAGALLGAGVALLFAPQSGRKTRRDIRKFAEKAGNKVEAARLELQHSINNIVEDVEQKLQQSLDSGMDWTDRKIDDLRRTLETTRKSIGGEIEKILSR